MQTTKLVQFDLMVFSNAHTRRTYLALAWDVFEWKEKKYTMHWLLMNNKTHDQWTIWALFCVKNCVVIDFKLVTRIKSSRKKTQSEVKSKTKQKNRKSVHFRIKVNSWQRNLLRWDLFILSTSLPIMPFTIDLQLIKLFLWLRESKVIESKTAN